MSQTNPVSDNLVVETSIETKSVSTSEVDMNSDGKKEVVLQTDYGNVLVLHSEDDTVYCYLKKQESKEDVLWMKGYPVK